MLTFAVFGGSYLYCFVNCQPEELGPILEKGFSVKLCTQMTIEDVLDTVDYFDSEEDFNG